MNVLLGVASSIAAYRALDLCSGLRKKGHNVRAVLSENVTNLVAPAAFEAITGHRAITTVWGSGHEAEMDHLAATKWADLFAFAPATANTLATLAHGLAPDALGTFAVAWNKAPFVIAPAMNPEMWRNAAVQANVATLRARGHCIVEPDDGPVACGDSGVGRLAPLEDIDAAIHAGLERWEPLPPLHGERILITGGPTREHLDDVRFLSNPSTGRMAVAIAREALAAGAEVSMVLGPCELALPSRLARVVRVVSAAEMRDAVLPLQPLMSGIFFTAAVSDWTPAERHIGKQPKEGSPERQDIAFVRTPDIALEASKNRRDAQVLIGFAAEAAALVENARSKAHRKSFDLVMANPVNEPGAGFAAETNRGTLVWPDGRTQEVPHWPKRRVARRLLAEFHRLRFSASG
jgi:phosphopantothenoylcysteine decarboxylase/phosphopantothenate--cysteine ligase